MTKTIVILGAGWAGLPLAHKLLKYTAPKTKIKVILVSPNSHFFWNVAATRGIIPGEIPDDQLFIPIDSAFKRYSQHEFIFVLGSARDIDGGNNTVVIERNDGGIERTRYDQLVIATGSRVASNLPFKPIGPHEVTMEAWHELQQRVENSKSIVIAGAGATGVEVAGELAAKYASDKTITLIMSGNKPLEHLKDVLGSLRDIVAQDLRKLGVVIINNARVTEVTDDESTGSTTIQLSNDSTITADCYLPLHGIKVNMSFVPEEFQDSNGNIKQDETMRVQGSENVWAIGDVGSLEPKQLTVTDNQIVHLATALDTVLTGSGSVSSYKPVDKTMFFLSLGAKYATGQIGRWRLWGFMVSYVKGRKLFVDTARGYVEGKHLRHASM